jgi:hypothetical protein
MRTSEPCLVCGAPCPAKDPAAPGPQPKYCGRTCQTKAAHAANVRRRRSNAAEVLVLRARVAQLEAELAAYGSVDWARVPPSALKLPAPPT